MGLIASRFEEQRNRTEWLMDDDDLWSTPMTSSGVRVNHDVAMSLTTIWRCVDLLASSISQAPKDVIVKVGGKSFPEFTPPDWLISPDPTNPVYTANDYFNDICVSMLLDGNYFVSVYPYVLDPEVLTVLDPAKVVVRKGPLYDLLDDSGRVVKTLGPMEILHGTWIRLPGALRGISPLEALRRGIGSAVAAEEHAARFFGQGASLSFGVETPGQLDETQKTNLAKMLRKKYAGLQNSHAVGVLTGGAKFVTGLAPTPEQAQMLATRKFSVEDLCRPYGVPPSFVGSQEPGASSYASEDIHKEALAERAALPLAIRIETQHNRLLSLPSGLSAPATVQFKVNLDHLMRVSLLTRYQAYQAGVLGGFLEPAEARALEDLPPVVGADQLFMQRQMVPITDLGTSAPIPGAPVDALIPKITPGQETAA